MTYIASVEIEPLPGSKMKGRSLGALVYCFIPASSKVVAKRRLHTVLEEDKYRLIRIELLENYEHFRWEKPDDQAEYDRLAKRAALTDDVIYGPFFTWKAR
ncbi:MAG TPA: hypothetical protein VJT71_13700 [Pyrinomonadaceae bacterium]|nr:hypothetical protein [Pyrinomonadaceae bacterium]